MIFLGALTIAGGEAAAQETNPASKPSTGLPDPLPSGSVSDPGSSPAPVARTPGTSSSPPGSSVARAGMTRPGSTSYGTSGSPSQPSASARSGPGVAPTGVTAPGTRLPTSLDTPNSPGSGSDTSTSSSVNAPTTVESAGTVSQTNNLARFLNIQNSPVQVYGWIQNSYTGNTNGRPRNDQNVTVFPNRLANSWQGNQYYLIFEKTLAQNDSINFGGRFDFLLGNDWQFTKSYGLLDREFKPNSFAGVDFPQIFAEVHLPILTKNGLDIRGGRFYSLAGFENVQAVKRPLLSVPYVFNFTPFTLFGVFATLHLNERTNIYSGAVNGWDRWIDQNYRYSYFGGFSYNSRDLRTSVTSIVLTGPDQLPRFAPANSPFLPTGVVTNPALQGKVNPDYAGNWRTYFDTTVTHTYRNERLVEAAEVFFVHETNVPGLGPNGTVNRESAWYGFTHWFIYNFRALPKIQGVWRAEVFHDQNGAATGFADNFYEMTVGAPYKPKPWLWIRPEARYDWAQFTKPYNDGTRGSQLTLAFDVILQF